MDFDYCDLADEGWNQDFEENSEPLAERSDCQRLDSTSAFQSGRFDFHVLSTNFLLDDDLPYLKRATSQEVDPEESPSKRQPFSPSIFEEESLEAQKILKVETRPEGERLAQLKSEIVASYHTFFQKYSHLLPQTTKTVKQGVGSFQKLFFKERKDYLYKKLFRDFKRFLKYVKSNFLDKSLKVKPKLGYIDLKDKKKIEQFQEIRNVFNEKFQNFESILKFQGKFNVRTCEGFLVEPVVRQLFTSFIALVFSFANTDDVERVGVLLNARRCFTESAEMREVVHEYLGQMIFLL
jgi:hypothetical protein